MRTILFVIVVFCTVRVQAQQNDFTALLEAGGEDAEKLIAGYLKPLYTAGGYGLAGGWMNTAGTHNVLGVDLTLSASFLGVPDSDLFYNTSDLGMNNTEQLNGDSAPTIFGPSGEEFRPQYRFTDPDDGEMVEYTGPEGIGLAEQMKDLTGIDKPIAPLPTVNLGFGLPANTDLRLRWLPAIRVGDDSNIRFWGIGVQHGLKPYFGLYERDFDLSGFIGFTSMRMKTDLRNAVVTTENEVISTDGEGSMRLRSLVIRGAVSKDLSVFTFFGAVGYTHVTSRTEVTGSYTYESGSEIKTVVDPIDFKLNTGGPSFTAGMRIKLLAITLHTSYTFQRYNSLELGFGINVN
ncbi:MAG: hypothetical protein P8X57_02650 [Cyclobacteriaceae bacterium]